MSYVEHINWIDFNKYDYAKPIYINMIRHPIDKVISAYYYRRHPYTYAFYVKNFQEELRDREYFDMSFSECVRQAKIDDCIFDSHNMFNDDWRRFAMHFCGIEKPCM